MNRIEKIESLLAKNPSDSFLRFALAIELIKIDNKYKALDILVALQEDVPDYVGTYYHLGKLHEEKNDIANAILIYKKGIEIAKNQNATHDWRELNGALLMIED